MGIEISKVNFYKPQLQKADTHGKKGFIDTPQEAEKALTFILDEFDVSSLPIYRDVLVQADSNGNGKIDKEEVENTRKLLLQGRTRQSVLENFVYFTPVIKQLNLPCLTSPEPLLDSPPIKFSGTLSNYGISAVRLAQFFLQSNGDPPNATKRFTVNGETAIGAYHVYEDDETHLRNGGATTSEGQVLFYNFMALYAALTGVSSGMDGAYNYIKYYLMPHDGKESAQLPDSLLTSNNPLWNPYLLHWLIDISGFSRSGDAIFSQNTAYEEYIEDKKPRARIAQVPNDLDPELGPRVKTVPTIHRLINGQDNTYIFGSALDADQWLQEGLFWAKTFGGSDHSADMKCFRESLYRGLTTGTYGPGLKNPYPQVMQFTYYWGAKVMEGSSWGGKTTDQYSGYQTPAAWQILGKPATAKRIVVFLKAAQDEYSKRYDISGPFMPVFIDGQFGWKGVDPNTDWMGFQYRTFAHLAHYYYLTGDTVAKEVLDKFYAFITANLSRTPDGKITIPTWVDRETGKVKMTGYTPNHHGLFAQGLIFMAAKSGDQKFTETARALLDDAVNNRQAKDGSFPDTEPIDGKGRRFTFRMAELGIALSLYDLLIKESK